MYSGDQYHHQGMGSSGNVGRKASVNGKYSAGPSRNVQSKSKGRNSSSVQGYEIEENDSRAGDFPRGSNRGGYMDDSQGEWDADPRQVSNRAGRHTYESDGGEYYHPPQGHPQGYGARPSSHVPTPRSSAPHNQPALTEWGDYDWRNHQATTGYDHHDSHGYSRLSSRPSAKSSTEANRLRIQEMLAKMQKSTGPSPQAFSSESNLNRLPAEVAHHGRPGRIHSEQGSQHVESPPASPRKILHHRMPPSLHADHQAPPSVSGYSHGQGGHSHGQIRSTSNSSFKGYMRPSPKLLAASHSRSNSRSMDEEFSVDYERVGQGQGQGHTPSKAHVPTPNHHSRGYTPSMDGGDRRHLPGKAPAIPGHMGSQQAGMRAHRGSSSHDTRERSMVSSVTSSDEILLSNDVFKQPIRSQSKNHRHPPVAALLEEEVVEEQGLYDFSYSNNRRRGDGSGFSSADFDSVIGHGHGQRRVQSRGVERMAGMDEDSGSRIEVEDEETIAAHRAREARQRQREELEKEKQKEEELLEQRLLLTRAWVVGNLTIRGHKGLIAGPSSDTESEDVYAGNDAAKEVERTHRENGSEQEPEGGEQDGHGLGEERHQQYRASMSSGYAENPTWPQKDGRRGDARQEGLPTHWRVFPAVSPEEEDEEQQEEDEQDRKDKLELARRQAAIKEKQKKKQQQVVAANRGEDQSPPGLTEEKEERGRQMRKELQQQQLLQQQQDEKEKSSEDSKVAVPSKKAGIMSALGFGGVSKNILQQEFTDVKKFYNVHEHELGRGRFGVIRVCEDKVTGEKLACKSISKKRLKCAQDVEDVRREVAVMQMLKDHPDVVHIRATHEDSHNVHLVMELCEGGELFDRIKLRKYYSERNAAAVTKTVAEVLKHCHSLGIIHRDLKPENILLCHPNDDIKIKVIDYGVAAIVKKGKMCKDMAGSPFYLAPEVLGERYGPPADVWSAGVVLYILLSGIPPFWANNNQGIFDAIKAAKLNLTRKPWPSISEPAKDLVRRMLTKDPRLRITPEEILDHPFICGSSRS